MIAPYAQARTEVDGVVTRTAGYDGTTARIKVNLWGNDGGRTALGVVPYVRFDADGLGVGLGAPLGVDLGRGFGLTVVPQLDQTPDGTSGSATFTIGHAVVGPLAAQVETSLVADDVVLDTLGVQANGGLCLLIGEDVELDAGSRFGVRGELPDVEVFVRVSARR